MPKYWRLLATIAAAAASVAGILAFVVAPLQGRYAGNLFDFKAYLGGAQAAARHGNVYAAFEHAQQNPQFAGFDYPPLVAWLLQPLTWLAPHEASIAWIWTMLACTLAAAIALSRAFLPVGWPRLQIAVLAVLLFTPATFNLGLGQLEPVVLLLLTLALVSYVQGDQLSCGACIGLAATLKLAPLVLVLILMKRRWWRASLAAAAVVAASAAAGVLVLGFGTTVDYATRVLPQLARQDGWLYNQSVGGVVNRVADHSVLSFQPSVAWITVLTLSTGVAAVAAALLITRCGARSPTARAMEFACGVLALLIAGSITWYLHYVLLLIPFFAAAAYIASGDGRKPVSLALAAALCALAVAAAGAVLSDALFVNLLLTQRGSFWWWPLLQLTSLPAISVFAFFVYAIRAMRRVDEPAPVTPTRVLRRSSELPPPAAATERWSVDQAQPTLSSASLSRR